MIVVVIWKLYGVQERFLGEALLVQVVVVVAVVVSFSELPDLGNRHNPDLLLRSASKVVLFRRTSLVES